MVGRFCWTRRAEASVVQQRNTIRDLVQVCTSVAQGASVGGSREGGPRPVPACCLLHTVFPCFARLIPLFTRKLQGPNPPAGPPRPRRPPKPPPCADRATTIRMHRRQGTAARGGGGSGGGAAPFKPACIAASVGRRRTARAPFRCKTDVVKRRALLFAIKRPHYFFTPLLLIHYKLRLCFVRTLTIRQLTAPGPTRATCGRVGVQQQSGTSRGSLSRSLEVSLDDVCSTDRGQAAGTYTKQL